MNDIANLCFLVAAVSLFLLVRRHGLRRAWRIIFPPVKE